jgi:hypothetical protein
MSYRKSLHRQPTSRRPIRSLQQELDLHQDDEECTREDIQLVLDVADYDFDPDDHEDPYDPDCEWRSDLERQWDLEYAA